MCFFPVGRKLFHDYNDIMLPLTDCCKSKSLRKKKGTQSTVQPFNYLRKNSYTYVSTKK